MSGVSRYNSYGSSFNEESHDRRVFLEKLLRCLPGAGFATEVNTFLPGLFQTFHYEASVIHHMTPVDESVTLLAQRYRSRSSEDLRNDVVIMQVILGTTLKADVFTDDHTSSFHRRFTF